MTLLVVMLFIGQALIFRLLYKEMKRDQLPPPKPRVYRVTLYRGPNVVVCAEFDKLGTIEFNDPMEHRMIVESSEEIAQKFYNENPRQP